MNAGSERLTLPAFNQQLAAQRAVAIHVLDVGFKRGIRVVDQVVVQRRGVSVEGDRLMNRTIFKLWRRGKVGGCAPEEAQLRVRVEAAMLDPSAQEKIAAPEIIRIRRRIRRQQES